eukprot:3981937-Pyramimonas_sp.AAC.1
MKVPPTGHRRRAPHAWKASKWAPKALASLSRVLAIRADCIGPRRRRYRPQATNQRAPHVGERRTVRTRTGPGQRPTAGPGDRCTYASLAKEGQEGTYTQPA